MGDPLNFFRLLPKGCISERTSRPPNPKKPPGILYLKTLPDFYSINYYLE